MKTKVFSIIIAFLTGVFISQPGIDDFNRGQSSHYSLVDASPKASLLKLNSNQAKEVFDVKIKGYDAYMVSIENNSRRSYSVCTSSFDQNIASSDEGKSILKQNPHYAPRAGLAVGGLFFWPVGVIGNIFSFSIMKKAKIFEGKLNAMLLSQEVIAPYSKINRVILVKDDKNISDLSIELIDMQTSQVKKIQVS